MLKRWIVPQFEKYPHKIYVEPFGGGASVLLHKSPSPVEVYNDLNGDLVSFFQILADPKSYKKFERIVSMLPVSRKIYNDYRATWQAETDPIQRAAKWFIVARQSFSGAFARSWGYALTASCRGMAATSSKWLSALGGLPEVHARLQRVQIENLPAPEIVRKYDTPHTLFYLDPPYILETRSVGKTYQHELGDDDHEKLVEQLLRIKGMAVLSAYEHPIYHPLLRAGWELQKKETTCFAAARTKGTGLRGKGVVNEKQKRTECLYLSPR